MYNLTYKSIFSKKLSISFNNKFKYFKLINFYLKKATQKIQPQTPIRTTSISNNNNCTTNNNNNNNNSSYHSVSSSSPSFSSSSSSSSSAYDTGLLQNEPQMPKQEELNEAIKRVAAEHLIKRQSQQSSDLSSPIYRASLPNGNGPNVFQLKQQLNSQVKSSFHVGSAAVKNELERALENRLRKQQQQEQSSQLTQMQQTIVNKRNVPRDPPPPVPNVESDTAVVISPQSPPPPPPPMAPLFSKPTPVQLLSNNSCSSFPPPPSPLALRRLSTTTIEVNPNISNKSPISPGPPPPPPPLPTSASPTLHVSVVTTPPVSTPSNLNVKSIINNYQQTTQQLLDPRTSSDFSELIAKKAAEKRAKFQETKPLISNAVTFQPDGSKVFATTNNIPTTNTTASANRNIDNSITNNKFLQPQPLANNTNTVNINLKKTNTTNLISTQLEKNVNISNISNGHAQVSSSSLSLSSSITNSSSSPSMSSTFSGKKNS